MLQISQNQKINVEALKLQLLRGKTTRGRFNLPYTYEQVYDMLNASVQAEVAWREREYQDSPEMQAYICEVARWMQESKTFGLLMCGVPGNGKTTIMKAMQSLLNYIGSDNALKIMSAKDIVRLNKCNYEQYERVCRAPFLGIDDLGTEPAEVMDYGNVLNPVVDLLLYRYQEQLVTVVTTNLKPNELRDKYQDRIADRFNEMMSKIIFKDRTYRKTN